MRTGTVNGDDRNFVPVLLIDATGARLDIERRQARRIVWEVVRPADVEWVACELTKDVCAAVSVSRERQAQTARRRRAISRLRNVFLGGRDVQRGLYWSNSTSCARRSTTSSTPSPVAQFVTSTGRSDRTSIASAIMRSRSTPT